MPLTKQQKQQILNLFYRSELREGEQIIDNRDKTIANELGLKKPQVTHFLYDHSIKMMDIYRSK